MPYQVYQLTRSSLDMGLVSLAQLFPLIAGSLLGGSAVDAFDRRRLLMVAQVLMAACSAGLAVTQTWAPRCGRCSCSRPWRPGSAVWTTRDAVVTWGAAITCFGLVSWLPGALALLAAAGWADVISAVLAARWSSATCPYAASRAAGPYGPVP